MQDSKAKRSRMLAAEGKDAFPGLSLWKPPSLSSPPAPHPNIQILLWRTTQC